MATKKDAKKATEVTVPVSVPAVKGVNLNDIYRAALTHARDQIPLTAVVEYEVVDTAKEKDARVYNVRISWNDVNDTDEDAVARTIDSLAVPTAIPAQDTALS
ncbi:hypothetical protein NIIDNTM18_42350 [Mycolicibacterium litorale]|uniref:Uncharacterized protein n=1 Tax=Mycolicibacterium litorale TaxID=758802 RepID=A0A6S6PBG1_9MYCO|nr:hypothetical protein [Mycolicibacterium litorale]BCI54957.1 hypothetical protein NIIDNTM18_42350 [Mycolicibacterium litorale]